MSGTNLTIPLHIVMQIRNALVASKDAAKLAHEANMEEGNYDKPQHLAWYAASDALTVFDVYIVKRLPTIDMKVTA